MSFREEGDWEPGPDMESDYCCAGCAHGHGCDLTRDLLAAIEVTPRREAPPKEDPRA